MSKSKDQKPLSLSDTLHDLALLRASDTDLDVRGSSTSTEDVQPSSANKAIEASLEKSYDYVQLARRIMEFHRRGDIDVQGRRIDSVREQLLHVEDGLAEE
ncbi:hypothetical protein Ac2012v2_004819 [Leucoagaricus gongylophorus]